MTPDPAPAATHHDPQRGPTTPFPLVLPDLHAYITKHPFYTHKTLIEEVYGGDEDAFFAAWASGRLPPDVRKTCQQTLGDRALEVALLAQVSQQLAGLTQAMERLLAALS